MKSNSEIADRLNEFSEILQLKKELSFKVVAYRKAEQGIKNYPTSVEKLYREKGLKGLQEIEGVGEGISEKIEEYIRFGKIKELESLKKKFPKAELELMKIPGVGSATAKVLYKKFGDIKIDELTTKLSTSNHGGLSEKLAQKIIKGVEILKNLGDRMLIFEAEAIAKKLTDFLEEHCSAINPTYVGSLRRAKETVGDIDIICASHNPSKTIEAFKKFGFKEILGQGDAKLTAILPNGKQMDLEIMPESEYGSLVLHFTGSKEHNVKLRALAQSKGMSLSEHGLKTKSGIKHFKSESAVYQALGLKYIEPELREDRGEIEAAINNNLPQLVQKDDIIGDIHLHSNWSDGISTIDEMAKTAKSLGYDYIGCADHLERFNNVEKIDKRHVEIEKASKKYGLHIFDACEVSIKKDGSIDYPDEILKKFDFVIASIHSIFDLADSTPRIIKAIENPLVRMIGHPTARMINRRPSINADWDKIFKACLQNNVILEINSSPYRLDLTDYLVFEGRKLQVKFAINTDAHSVADFETLQYGIMVARRGWCEKSDIINTSSLEKIKKIFSK